MNSYGIEFIGDINNLKIGKYHYQYDGIDFMFNYKKNAQKTLIIFHAKVDTNSPIPVFHKYDYENELVNVLSFSDKLLEKYQYLNSTCFMDLPNENYHEKYKFIINFILKKAQTLINIFYGSCSGALPALYFGCMFNEIILSTNAYIYYNDLERMHNKKAGFNTNLFIYPDMEQVLLDYKPKHIYLYFNRNDKSTNSQNIKFVKYCNDIMPDKITYKSFGSDLNKLCCENFYFPEDESFDNIINTINK